MLLSLTNVLFIEGTMVQSHQKLLKPDLMHVRLYPQYLLNSTVVSTDYSYVTLALALSLETNMA
jgi:hypothetical protein